MKKILYSSLDFFLPQYCAGCDKKIISGSPPVCDECFSSILSTDPERIESEYNRKFRSSGYVQDIFSLYVFENEGTLQNIIHSLKYKKRFTAGTLLGKKLAYGLQKKLDSWSIDLIIPVPLHPLKKAERGFNQSDFIVKGLTEMVSIPSSGKIIRRIRFTESQTRLRILERKENVANAFKVKREKIIADKNILIVDDVITTGSTINECAKTLVENSAAEIYACSVAIAE